MLSVLTGALLLLPRVCVATTDTSGVPVIFPAEYSNNQTVAEVNGIRISADEFYYGYEFGPAFVKREKNSKEIYLNYLINEKLFASEGLKKNIDTTQNFKSYYKEIEADLVTEALYRNEILNRVSVSENEIDSLAKSKKIELAFRWLFTENESEAGKWYSFLKENSQKFDSVFSSQLKENSQSDDRSMKTTFFQLNKKNPQLAEFLLRQKTNEISEPVFQNDGWYLFRIDQISVQTFITETEWTTLKSESKNSLIKQKSDKLSDNYVHQLLLSENPVIKRQPFNLLIAYIGLFELEHQTYLNWKLDEVQKNSLEKLELNSVEKIPDLILVGTKNKNYTISDFISWYKSRSDYLHPDKKVKERFVKDVESFVWQMLRDQLLTREAFQKGYQNNEWVKKQAEWWKEKIAYSLVRDEVLNSVGSIPEKEMNGKSSEKNGNEKILRKLQALKKNADIKTNVNVLNAVSVSDENDIHSIEMYFVHKGGLIPRLPYPSIDQQWASWE